MHSGTTTVHQLMLLHTDTPRQGGNFTLALLFVLDGPAMIHGIAGADWLTAAFHVGPGF